MISGRMKNRYSTISWAVAITCLNSLSFDQIWSSAFRASLLPRRQFSTLLLAEAARPTTSSCRRSIPRTKAILIRRQRGVDSNNISRISRGGQVPSTVDNQSRDNVPPPSSPRDFSTEDTIISTATPTSPSLSPSSASSSSSLSETSPPPSLSATDSAGYQEMRSTLDEKSNSKNSLTTTKITQTMLEPPMGWFTKARRTIFPIYGEHEVTKFLLLGSIKFFIILALTLTRDTKDTLVVTQCGAEAIAFLKIYGVLPAAATYIALYSKLSNALSKKSLFYATCIPFFIFFGLFDLFIYPNAKLLHPSLVTVSSFLPGGAQSGGLAVLAKIVAHWTTALFYVMAEIYSSVSVGLMFWAFANDVVPVDQAKRFYPLFAQMSGLAPVLAGQYVVHYTSTAKDFGQSMHRLTAAVTFAGVMICVFYKLATTFIERTEKTIPDPALGGSTEGMPKKKKKPKMSMTESARFLASSQYLRLIAMLVLGYGLSINFSDIMWKSLIKKQYPEPLDYARFMGNFSSAVGLSTCIVILFGVHVIRILGWRVGAMATPGIMAILGLPFFVCILMGLDSPVRLQIAVIFGTIQSLLSKTSKYALFDPTTQMAYIPLDEESKVKGKAAIDVLGSRIGKSGGSLIQQGLVFVFGNILGAAPVLSVLYYGVVLTWLSAANRLSHLFRAKTEMEKAKELEAKKLQ